MIEMERHLILGFLTLSLTLCQISGQSLSDIIPVGYNPNAAPNGNGVTNVNISASINSLLAVTESTSSFQLDITFNLKWIDKRLNMASLAASSQSANTSTSDLLFGSNFIQNFWTPDIYFQNALSVSLVNTGFNIQTIAIGLNDNITYTRRLSGTFICKMDLTSYPQDYHHCSIEAVSLTKTKSQISLIWTDLTSAVRDTSKFRITKTSVGNCIRNSNIGDFSCVMGSIKLVRRVSYYIIRYYAPSFLQVVVTFVGFWIPPVGFPARVIVVVTPLLAMIVTSVSVSNDINVEYVVTIYWWMIFCEIFAYFAICEYALAISWAHFANEKKAAKQPDRHGNIPFVTGHYFGNNGLFHALGCKVDKILYFFFGNVDYTKEPMVRNKIDYCSRVLFPILWILFSFLFAMIACIPWSYYYNA